jgi:hypothetical protein
VKSKSRAVPKKSATKKLAAKKSRRSPDKIGEIDATKRHAVTLTFLMHERISPHELAQRLASRCGGYELMPGEAIRVDHGKIACVVTDETLSLPHFGWRWYRSMKDPKWPKLQRNTCR